MHKRLFLVGAVLVALATVATAGAVTFHGASAAQTLRAAPFNAAAVPSTLAAQKAKSTLVFGMEQDITGFNLSEADETSLWAAITGETAVIRGTYIIDQEGNYHLDLASSVVATPKTLTITIRPDANWNWGGKVSPVTNQDVAYTWKQFMDPKNNVATTTGYSQITGYTLKGTKTIIFHWKTPFADYRDLFGYIYPSKALAGLSFNTFWSNCVCGNNGQPISDGPFILTNYTRGAGVTLKSNPDWYGTKPGLKEIDFKLITDTNSEIQAMRGGEVDAIYPSPQTALSELVEQSGLTYSSISGYTQEHWDFQFGPKGNPLLKSPWMRQAIAHGHRSAFADQGAVRADLARSEAAEQPRVRARPERDAAVRPVELPPKKALALLAKHCTGGPSVPTANSTAVWTCAGHKAEFRFTTTAGNARRATSAAIFSSQLAAIGIKLDVSFQPANPNFFGQTLPGNDFDIAEYAWSGGPDPSGFDAIYQCVNAAQNLGGQNYKLYCNRKVDNLLKAGDAELDPTKRTADYEQAAALMAADVPVIPLYSPPNILVYKSAIKGMQDSNNPTQEGPTWNAELWHW